MINTTPDEITPTAIAETHNRNSWSYIKPTDPTESQTPAQNTAQISTKKPT